MPPKNQGCPCGSGLPYKYCHIGNDLRERLIFMDLDIENGVWALITLTIHSDLNAVGFLAAITKKLAESNISVNAVSAYYHDHLFVPFEKSKQTMKLLQKISDK